MNRKHIASAVMSVLMVTAAGAAFAQAGRSSDAYPEGSQFAWVSQTSQVSREQVRQELVDARAQGLIPQNDYEYPVLATMQPNQAPGKTRAQVYDDLVRARQNGEMKYSNP
ncbi:hypothetical protein PanNE5_40360 [Pandoraea sp. NE5]|uniref:DUF4148 domain-containing protein n=1 Tax=Pandoraea sp. NE5 TaxID=2904129 RepID=UPI0021C39306|nr:DUF4148 domain-containing protein [Pandoraea sp. NE5]BDD94596.1 hypothetical protein PanNE5_40360 [Pandoraea sp. NE5]